MHELNEVYLPNTIVGKMDLFSACDDEVFLLHVQIEEFLDEGY